MTPPRPESTGEPARLRAVEEIRRMRGGSQSHLMRCSDGGYYVIKFQNNPQGVRTLANEQLGSVLARKLGLPVPESAIIDVESHLIESSDDLVIQLPKGRVPCQAGLCFGSRFVGNYPSTEMLPVWDFFPEDCHYKLENASDFAGMLVFDTWTGNKGDRQAVFVEDVRPSCLDPQGPCRRYRVFMIDHGFCFNADEWNFPDAPKRGLYPRCSVYKTISGIEGFEPWLSRVECGMDSVVLREAALQIPPEWYGHDTHSLARLVANLDERRTHVRELLLSTRRAVPQFFPAWHATIHRNNSRFKSLLI